MFLGVFLSITGTASVGAELSITGGNLTLNGTSSVNNFTQSSGSLSGTGVLTITGASTITFGDHRGTGTTILQGPSTISSSGFRLDGGRTLRNEDTLTWSGGTILFNNNVNGTQINGSGTLNNLAGATFIASGDAAAEHRREQFRRHRHGRRCALHQCRYLPQIGQHSHRHRRQSLSPSTTPARSMFRPASSVSPMVVPIAVTSPAPLERSASVVAPI